jgi:DMSO reductase anchor subunit
MLRTVKWAFLLMVFPLPVLALTLATNSMHSGVFLAAFAIQYLGLLAERWFFFAQANHPQNLYYQNIS